MKTTLVVDDALMRRLKALAARRGITLSALVEGYLRRGLLEDRRVGEEGGKSPDLPAHDMGLPLADLADRAALDDLMDGGSRGRR